MLPLSLAGSGEIRSVFIRPHSGDDSPFGQNLHLDGFIRTGTLEHPATYFVGAREIYETFVRHER
jgi:hypothetical protein